MLRKLHAPGLEFGQHRRAQLLAHGEALLRGLPDDPALNVEQQVDPVHRLQRKRRDRRRGLAAPCAGRDVGELAELPSRVWPERLNATCPGMLWMVGVVLLSKSTAQFSAT